MNQQTRTQKFVLVLVILMLLGFIVTLPESSNTVRPLYQGEETGTSTGTAEDPPTDAPSATNTSTATATSTSTSTATATNTATATATNTPDEHHDVGVHLFVRQPRLNLRVNRARQLIIWADVSSHSTHFGEDDTVNVVFTQTAVGPTCATPIVAPEVQVITVRPGHRRLVRFERSIICNVPGMGVHVVSYHVAVTHVGDVDVDPSDNQATLIVTADVR